MRKSVRALVAASTVAALAAALTIGPAKANQVPVPHAAHDRVVSAVPASWTPQIKDGKTQAIVQVGNTMVVGGAFTKVSNSGGGGLVGRQNIVSFNATTGAIIATFNPTIGGAVVALEAGPTSDTVYIGGAFSSVNGVAGKVFLLNVNTGKTVATFKGPAMNGAVQSLVKAGNRLFVGGNFTSVANQPRNGLATLNATTGALDSFLTVSLTEHHNYTGQPGEAIGPIGARALDISPDGRWLVVVGNFKKADGLPRDQAVMIDLISAAAVVRGDWRTQRFEPRCSYKSFDVYVRDVSFGPDGSFSIAATGAPYPGTLCDTTSHWTTTGSLTAEPQWIQDTGGDTMFSVADTGVAVYAGGHQRWHNNAGAKDAAGPGAVPRPGIGGFDIRNGVPLSWNPGRQPRGIGAEALYVTAKGLWMGSDTDYVGNNKYWRPRLAFFPLVGGKVVGAGVTNQLPANIYQATTTLSRSWYDGTAAPTAPVAAPGGGIAWNLVRGALVIDGELFYNTADGNFHRRTFDGTTYGADQLIDPYNDPAWSSVQTGSGTGTYRGKKPSYYTDIASIRGLGYSAGRLYYTKNGSSQLFSRAFSPESGILTEASTTVA
ncbi:MAG TPA: PKD domain containing protein, partial [Kribbella sp.]